MEVLSHGGAGWETNRLVVRFQPSGSECSSIAEANLPILPASPTSPGYVHARTHLRTSWLGDHVGPGYVHTRVYFFWGRVDLVIMWVLATSLVLVYASQGCRPPCPLLLNNAAVWMGPEDYILWARTECNKILISKCVFTQHQVLANWS